MKSSTENKIDETIESICDWIQEETKNRGLYGVSENLPAAIEALTKLVSVRAMLG